MHILLIHQNFAALSEPGGTRHHELARYLIERGHRVTVIASPVSYLTGSTVVGEGSPGKASPSENVNILRPYAYPAFHRSFFHRLISFFSFMITSFVTGLRVPEVDLVWGTSPPIFQGLTAWAVARLKGVPFIFEVRDLWPAFAVAVGVLRQPGLVWASEKLERFLYRQADRLVVNSPGFIEHVKARGARKVELVPNGADPDMFDPTACGDQFRQEHGLQGKFIALYAGAHGLSNDLGVVLQAAELLKAQPEIQIVFLGDGKEKRALQDTASKRKLSNVSFLPPIPKAGMKTALAAADACIAILKPIAMYETVYPNKVFDYMAAARPVVLAIGGVIRHVVEQAEAGIFVSPGDPAAMAVAIDHLASDPETGRKMGKRGRAYLERHFDRAVLAEKLVQVFEDALSSQA